MVRTIICGVSILILAALGIMVVQNYRRELQGSLTDPPPPITPPLDQKIPQDFPAPPTPLDPNTSQRPINDPSPVKSWRESSGADLGVLDPNDPTNPRRLKAVQGLAVPQGTERLPRPKILPKPPGQSPLAGNPSMRKSGLSSSNHTNARRSYTVKSGDSLSRISKNCYGSAHYCNLLAEANKIPPPFLIRPGQILVVPDVKLAVQERELRATEGPKGQGAIAEEQRQGALRKANNQGETWEPERFASGMVPRPKAATPLSPLPLSPAQREEALRTQEKFTEPVAPSDRRDDEFEPLPPTLERRLKAIP